MEEPQLILRWVMFHFGGGDALLVGLLFLLAISWAESKFWKNRNGRWTLVTIVAVFWGLLASPAWPIWTAVPFLVLLVSWRVVLSRTQRTLRQTRVAEWAVRIACVGLLGYEWLVTWPAGRPGPFEQLCVIGDSVTAGLNDGERTWPRLCSEMSGLTVRDASQQGATCRLALGQAQALEDDSSPLILEIGGNDLLSGLPVAEFEQDLEKLCKRVCQPGRTVWMCELPLPPLCSRYGIAQRRLSQQYGMRLISKRRFMAVLCSSGGTVDGVHLSEQGQQRMCDLMLTVTGSPTTAARAGRYIRCARTGRR